MPEPINARVALLRAATYLKWFRDRGIAADTEPPDDIGEVIVTLEQLAASEHVEIDDLELGELPRQPTSDIDPTD